MAALAPASVPAPDASASSHIVGSVHVADAQPMPTAGSAHAQNTAPISASASASVAGGSVQQSGGSEPGVSDGKRLVVPEIKDLPPRAAALLGRVLRLDDLDSMPTANDFLDETVRSVVDASIAANRDIIFTSVKMTVQKWSDPGQKYGWKFRFLWHGRGLDGRVMLLIVDDVFPTMYVQCPAEMKQTDFIDVLGKDLRDLKLLRAGDIEIVMRKRLVYFEVDPKPYARVMFTRIDDFDKAHNHFRNIRQWIVADTDYTKSRFYLQAVRANDIAPAGMNMFRYKQHGNPYPMHIDSTLGDVFVVSIKDVRPFEVPIGEAREAYVFPRLTNLNFDIETGSAERGKALDANRDDTHAHVVSLTMRYNRRDLVRVSLTTSPHVVPKMGYIQFVCDSEVEMFMMFAHIVRRLRPAIITTYNGDNFDWRFIVTKMMKYDRVEAFFATLDFLVPDFSWLRESGINKAMRVARHYMHDTTVKISAEEMKCPVYYPNLVSFLNIDIFTMCKRKWPSGKYSEKSLNAFLKLVGEPLKFDMPAWRQFDIYEEKLVFDVARAAGRQLDAAADPRFATHVAEITDVNVYCVFDTISALDLYDRANIWLDLSITAQHNVCTLYESTMLAKGGIVIDKFVTSAFRAGYLDCNETHAPAGGKYPGALVVHPPKRGLTTITPRADELRATNPLWAAVTDADVKLMEAAFLNSFADPASWPAIKELTASARPPFEELIAASRTAGIPSINGDFASMYPTIMAEHNASPERMVRTVDEEKELVGRGYTLYTKDRIIDGRNVHTAFIKEPGGRDKRGLIPAEQEMLRLKRIAINKELKAASAAFEKMERGVDEYAYDVAEANVARLNAGQLECKISMNTYYGKMGDQTNKFYDLRIASDVTLSGREYLRFVIDTLVSLGWTDICYGDTDSVYVRPPQAAFADIHARWFGGAISRLEYANQLVARALELGADMMKKINAALRATGSDFMTMALEGAHFPSLYIRQKRNATGFHTPATGPAFKADGTPSHLHVTGVADKKGKSASKLFIRMSLEVLQPMLNVFNTRDVKQVAHNTITNAYARILSGEWPMDMFIKRGCLKPEKHNIAIINFCERLRAEGRTPPRPYEKFDYVFVRRDNIEFGDDGCKASTAGADYMELYDHAIEQKLPIHIGKYMTGEICSELGQYMCCNAEFVVPAVIPAGANMFDEAAQDACRVAEEATQDSGKAYITQLCKEAGNELPTSVRKPVYMSIRKGVASAVTRYITKPAGLDQRRVKFISNLAAGSAYDVFASTVATEATKKSHPISDAMATEAETKGELIDLPTVQTLRERLIGPLGPRAIWAQTHGARREQLDAELREFAGVVDAFAAWMAVYTKQLSAQARVILGLDKAIITLDDVNAASQVLTGPTGLSELKMATPPTVAVPTAAMFTRCDTILAELINIDRHAIACDTFTDLVTTRIEQLGKTGHSMSRREIADMAAAAETGIATPAELFEA